MESPETPKDTPAAIFTAVHALYVAPVAAAVVAGLILWQLGIASQPEDLPPIPEDGWLIVIHESVLRKAYADDPVNADQHFKGQMIQVTGYVYTGERWYTRDDQVDISEIHFPNIEPSLVCHFP